MINFFDCNAAVLYHISIKIGIILAKINLFVTLRAKSGFRPPFLLQILPHSIALKCELAVPDQNLALPLRCHAHPQYTLLRAPALTDARLDCIMQVLAPSLQQPDQQRQLEPLGDGSLQTSLSSVSASGGCSDVQSSERLFPSAVQVRECQHH